MRSFTMLAVLGLLVSGNLNAAELKAGDKAPALEVAKFVKGDPVKGFEKGTVYVVEFWATWCGPCKATIPHLTRLQKAHKDVVVIGVSVLEENQADVEPYVKKMGDKMNYRVAMDMVPEGSDSDEGKMVEHWLDASDSEGIPTAFIVNKEGIIAWIGHPARMANVLESVLAGKWDIDAFAQSQKLQEELIESIGSHDTQDDLNEEEAKKLLDTLDTYFKKSALLEGDFSEFKFNLLMKVKNNEKKAAEYAAVILEKFSKDDSETLNSIAWTIIGPETAVVEKLDKKLLEIALKISKRSDELTEGNDFAINDTLARCYFFNGDKKKAVEYQEKSLKLLAKEEMEIPETEIQEMRQRLEEYKKAVKDN